MRKVTEAGRDYSPQEVQDQESYYWIVSLWAGNPNGAAVGVQDDKRVYRELITKKYERATELANQWLSELSLSDGRQLFVVIEEMAVKSSVVYVK